MHPSPKTAAIALAALVSLTTAGCGAVAEKASEKATEQVIESQTGGDVDVNADGDGSVEFETDDGSFSVGTGEVPADWPDDVPLPDDVEVLSGATTDTPDGKLVGITAATDESPEDLLAGLKDALGDWEISGETTTSGDGSMTGAQWERDGRRVNFAATSGGDGQTSLTLSHTTAP